MTRNVFACVLIAAFVCAAGATADAQLVANINNVNNINNIHIIDDRICEEPIDPWLNQGIGQVHQVHQMQQFLLIPHGCGGGNPTPPRITFSSVETPGDASVTPGTGNVLMNVLRCTPSYGGGTLTSLTIQHNGTGLAEFDITRVALYRDVDNSKSVTEGDALLVDGATFAGGNTLLLDFSTFTVSSTTYLLVEYDFAGTAIDDRTFTANVTGASVGSGTSSVGIPNSTQSREITIQSDVHTELSMIANNPFDAEVEAGSDAVVAGFTCESSGGMIHISGLTVQALGGLIDSVDITSTSLVRDQNRNGVVDGIGEGGDSVLDTSVFFADDGAVTFSFDDVMIGAGGAVDFLITYTISEAAPAGELASLRIISVTNDANEVNASLPMDSSTITIVSPAGDDDGEGETGGDDDPLGSFDSGDQDFGELTISTTAGGVGCNAGLGNSAAGLALLLLAMVALGTIRRRS